MRVVNPNLRPSSNVLQSLQRDDHKPVQLSAFLLQMRKEMAPPCVITRE